MNNSPLVSVIVPSFNHADFLQNRLESIFNQTFQNFEVILLDDHSTDRSRMILSNYADNPKVSHCLFNEENSGSTFYQWDKGINLAKGEFIWIAETDDSCYESFLEKLLEPHKQENGLALSYCQSYRMNVKGVTTGDWSTHTSGFETNPFTNDFIKDGNLFIEKFLIHKNVIPNVSGVLFRTKNLKKISPLIYEPFMKYNADWFYYIQLICNSKVAFIAEPLNYFRYHKSSVIAQAGNESGDLRVFKMELKGRKKMMKFIEKSEPYNFQAIKKQVSYRNNQLYHLIAREYSKKGGIILNLLTGLRGPRFIRQVLNYISKEKHP